MPSGANTRCCRKVAQAAAGDALDHQAEQQEVGVAVQEAAARREVQVPVAGDATQHGGAVDVRVQAHAAQAQHLQEVGQPAGVAHQVFQRHRLRQRRQFRQMGMDLVVQRQPPLRGQHQHRGDGELLGHRRHAKRVRGLSGTRQLQAGQAIGAAEQRLAAALHADHAAGRARRGDGLEEASMVPSGVPVVSTASMLAAALGTMQPRHGDSMNTTPDPAFRAIPDLVREHAAARPRQAALVQGDECIDYGRARCADGPRGRRAAARRRARPATPSPSARTARRAMRPCSWAPCAPAWRWRRWRRR